jgi:hypothetical protein
MGAAEHGSDDRRVETAHDDEVRPTPAVVRARQGRQRHPVVGNQDRRSEIEVAGVGTEHHLVGVGVQGGERAVVTALDADEADQDVAQPEESGDP